MSPFVRWLRFNFVGIAVQHLHLPLLVANAIAIVCCSLVNFFVGDAWVFAATTKVVPNPAVLG